MKKYNIFVIVLFVQINLYAQEYYPEGTKWTEIRLDTLKYDNWYSKVGDEWVPNFETIEYYVKGEYIEKEKEEDRTFRKVYTNGLEWRDSLTLMLWEGNYNGNAKCVLVTIPPILEPDEYTFVLWPGEAYQYDWSNGKGIYYSDILKSNTTSTYPYYFYYGIIDEIKEGDFGGVRPLRYVDLDGKAPIDIHEPGNTDTNGGRIIQGIGITEWNDGECLFGPPNPYRALSLFKEGFSYEERHYRSMLVYFERDGEVLYDVWPDRVSSVNNVPSVAPQQDGPIYDLEGRKVSSQPSYSLPTREGQGGSLRKGLYIQNGKKVAVK